MHQERTCPVCGGRVGVVTMTMVKDDRVQVRIHCDEPECGVSTTFLGRVEAVGKAMDDSGLVGLAWHRFVQAEVIGR